MAGTSTAANTATATPAQLPSASAPSARNPFDLVGRSAGGLSDESAVAPPTTSAAEADEPLADGLSRALSTRGRFDALLGLLLLVLLSVSFVLQGSSLRRMYEAALNANLLDRLRRDQRKGGYYLWAFLGAVSGGTFVFAAARALGYVAEDAGWGTLDVFVLATLGVILAKLFALTFLRVAFPLERAVDTYRALILVYAAVLGVASLPLTLLCTFASPGVAAASAYVGLALGALGVALLGLRALAANTREVSAYPLHFLVYLCALEIGPLAVAYKLLTG